MTAPTPDEELEEFEPLEHPGDVEMQDDDPVEF